jgi:replicative DNA helicase
MEMELAKVPPQNLEAEQAVLGALMLEPETGSSVFEILQPEDFYRDNHRLIYIALRDLFERGDPVDLVSVAEILRQSGRLEQVGGIATVSEIARSVPSAVNIEFYAKIVAEKSMLRQLIRVAGRIAEKGYEPGEEATALLAEAEKFILDLTQRQVKDGFESIRKILLSTFEKIEFGDRAVNRALLSRLGHDRLNGPGNQLRTFYVASAGEGVGPVEQAGFH